MATDGGADHGLVFDLGMHEAQDTEFYLRKGFRVVAIDANADLCEQAARRLSEFVADGRLTIVNTAIADEPGEVTLFVDATTEWTTIDPRWAARNRMLGSSQTQRTVPATTLAGLIAEHGLPYFLKIDIEGMDMVALRGLYETPLRPNYVSIESDKTSFRALREEFRVLTELGYDAFKVVAQGSAVQQPLPQPPREGDYVDWQFAFGSSGAFGDEAPGDWLDVDAAIDRYRRVFLAYAFTGDDPYLGNKFVRWVLARTIFPNRWYDTHARLAADRG